MTWLKCSDDYADGCVQLTDAEYRTLHEALLWVMRREDGPRFRKRELHRFAETNDPESAMSRLVALGYVADYVDHYEVLYHYEWQQEPDVIVRRRKKDAARQRRKRRRDVGLPEDD
jgi:hypothetical protein